VLVKADEEGWGGSRLRGEAGCSLLRGWTRKSNDVWRSCDAVVPLEGAGGDGRRWEEAEAMGRFRLGVMAVWGRAAEKTARVLDQIHMTWVRQKHQREAAGERREIRRR